MPAGRICIEVAVSEPSLLLVPVTVTSVPAVKSLAVPMADFNICVEGLMSTSSLLLPFCCWIEMLVPEFEIICPAVKPPPAPAPNPPRAPAVPVPRVKPAPPAANPARDGMLPFAYTMPP
jgi:hypothetical protein